MDNASSSILKEQFRRMSQDPYTTATFKDQADSTTNTSDHGGGKNEQFNNLQPSLSSIAANIQEDLRKRQTKFTILEDMIAEERSKRSMLHNLDSNPVKNLQNNNLF